MADKTIYIILWMESNYMSDWPGKYMGIEKDWWYQA